MIIRAGVAWGVFAATTLGCTMAQRTFAETSLAQAMISDQLTQ